ncbi:Aminomethyltransferase [Dirofilaria immitis]
MQNVRGRPRMLARRHARVHFNLNGRLRSSTPHEIFPEDTTRDSILKQILVRIKKSEGELSTCRNRTNELLKIPEDSLTASRINHEQYLLDDLIDFIEQSIDDEMKLQMATDEDNQRWYAKRLKRSLLNWIARNETEIREISALESRIMKRYVQISRENKYLQRMFRDIKYFTNPISDSFKIVKKSSELTFVGTSKTQILRTDHENEENFKNDIIDLDSNYNNSNN